MSTRTSRALLASAAVAAACGVPASAAAQQFEASTAAQLVTYRTRAGGPVAERSSAYYGGSAAVWLGDFKLGIEGLFGSIALGGSQSFALRATTLQAGMRSGPFEFGGQAEARRRAALADTSIVRLIGAYGKGTADFGAGFSGNAQLAWYPIARALNDDPIHLALRTEVGARYAPPGSRLSFFTSYRVFRLDYQSAGAADPRLEQDAGIVIGLAFGGTNR